jgi:DNA-binding FadR family transcriptional regulator
MPIEEDEATPYGLLRRLIASRRLQPGDRVPSQRDLARRFGVSLVAARDALVAAERDGLVEIRPRAGAFVRAAVADLADGVAEGRATADAGRGAEASLHVIDGYQLHLCHARELLEVETAGQAALRARPADLLPVREALGAWLRARDAGDARAEEEADRRFHHAIALMAGNPVIAGLVAQCLRQQYMQECKTPELPADRDEVAAIHLAIYEALRDRDAERAREAMRRHMNFLEHNIQQMLWISPGRERTAPPGQSTPRRKVQT